MNQLNGVFATTVLLLAGCASHHGTYAPDCVAFAGNSVRLDGAGFVWDRFTDQVKVDDSGEVIDPYPDYPLRGSYSLDGQTVNMRADSGQSMDSLFLHKIDGTYRLLTAKQAQDWQRSGEYDNCVLTLGAGDSN